MAQGSTGIQPSFSLSLGWLLYSSGYDSDLFLNGPGLRPTVLVSVCELMHVVVSVIVFWESGKGLTATPTL